MSDGAAAAGGGSEHVSLSEPLSAHGPLVFPARIDHDRVLLRRFFEHRSGFWLAFVKLEVARNDPELQSVVDQLQESMSFHRIMLRTTADAIREFGRTAVPSNVPPTIADLFGGLRRSMDKPAAPSEVVNSFDFKRWDALDREWTRAFIKLEMIRKGAAPFQGLASKVCKLFKRRDALFDARAQVEMCMRAKWGDAWDFPDRRADEVGEEDLDTEPE